jgi:hypothetical protein
MIEPKLLGVKFPLQRFLEWNQVSRSREVEVVYRSRYQHSRSQKSPVIDSRANLSFPYSSLTLWSCLVMHFHILKDEFHSRLSFFLCRRYGSQTLFVFVQLWHFGYPAHYGLRQGTNMGTHDGKGHTRTFLACHRTQVRVAALIVMSICASFTLLAFTRLLCDVVKVGRTAQKLSASRHSAQNRRTLTRSASSFSHSMSTHRSG